MSSLFFPDMRIRSIRKELMDTPDVDTDALRNTVRQFAIFNAVLSASRSLIRSTFFPIMKRAPDRTYSMLDIGAGGCDIALWAVREARRRGLSLRVTALEKNPRIIGFAAEAIKGEPQVGVVEGDALELGRLGVHDFVFSNHFLHHLEWDEIEIVMRQVVENAGRAFIMNDLERSRWAYAAFSAFTGLFIRNSLAFEDGRLSLLRGFTAEELSVFLKDRFEGVKIDVRRRFPARIYLRGVK